MNTPASPRDLLLARHAAARPALDSQRDALLARFAVSPPPAAPSAESLVEPAWSRFRTRAFSPRGVFETLWRELFVPCRGAWAAFACLWLAILAIDRLESLGAEAAPAAQVARSDSAWLAVWLEQRRLLAELVREPFGPAASAPVALPVSIPAPAVPPLGFIEAAPDAARYV